MSTVCYRYGAELHCITLLALSVTDIVQNCTVSHCEHCLLQIWCRTALFHSMSTVCYRYGAELHCVTAWALSVTDMVQNCTVSQYEHCLLQIWCRTALCHGMSTVCYRYGAELHGTSRPDVTVVRPQESAMTALSRRIVTSQWRQTCVHRDSSARRSESTCVTRFTVHT